MLTADLVWGTAVAAHRINGGYFKSDVYNTETQKIETRCNKVLVKFWLLGKEPNPVTENDIIEGREVRRHFTGYLLLQLSGKINDFQTTALKLTQREEFDSAKDSYQLSVVSCLPYVMLKDHANKQLMDQIRESDQLTGTDGQRVEGDIQVIKQRYSIHYNKYHITARMNNSFVDFWFNKELPVGGEYTIKGKIKNVRGDNTTQLNYVKIVVDKTAV
jgi:hypothetical protein